MAADRQLDAQLFRGWGESFWVCMQPCPSQQFPSDLLLCAALLRLSLPSPAFSASPVQHTQQLLLLTPFQVGTIPKSMGRIALKTASTSPALALVVMSSQCGKIFTDLCKQSISVELRVWWEQRNFWMFCPPQDSWHTIIIPPILQMGKMKLRKLPKLLQELCDRGLNTIQISQPDSLSNYLENMNNKTSREV